MSNAPQPRILTLDIETKPAQAYVWGMFDQNVGLNQLIAPSAPICVAAKWLGEPEIMLFSDWEHGHDEMIRALHALISEADAIVGYNSERFDIPKLMGEFLLLKLTPPPPVASIDLYKTVKKFGFQSGKLAYIGPFLKIGAKVKNEGFDLWAKVEAGDPKAQLRMARYCMGDVRLTEKLYKRILPFIKNHPNFNTQPSGSCGACGSTRVQQRGYRRTKYFKIKRQQCQNCGSWFDGTRSKA